MAKCNTQACSTRRGRFARAVGTVAATIVLTVAALGAGSASADPSWDPCDEVVNMPCTTH